VDNNADIKGLRKKDFYSFGCGFLVDDVRMGVGFVFFG